ncbi:MAG: hypothetical protein KBF21_00180 [Thermoanaerobaculia bacterium]|jgi:hypothetical protein|nr:hypothetical protein [Thermoanaerobaculia bacterium]MBP9822612.1 hypothetical protein [Thermoanaerobaculia bacterium]
MSEMTETLPPQTAAPRPPAASPAAPVSVPSAAAPPASQYLSILDSRRKSPGLACFLSLMPGLGQVYVGYYQRGFVHAAVVAGLMTVLSSEVGELTPMTAMFMVFFWLYNIIDAGRRAALYNEVLAGRTGIQLPTDLMLPGLGGSMLGGTVVALVGALLLAHTAFGMSLSWLKEWWPVAVILFGAYLFIKARMDRPETPETADLA